MTERPKSPSSENHFCILAIGKHPVRWVFFASTAIVLATAPRIIRAGQRREEFQVLAGEEDGGPRKEVRGGGIVAPRGVGDQDDGRREDMELCICL